MTLLDLQVAITTVPKRSDYMINLLIQLETEGFSNIEIFIDHMHAGPFANTRNALESCTGDHILILQDDITIAGGFGEVLPHLIEARPYDVMYLYSMHDYILDARDLGLNWVEGVDGVGGQAILWPKAKIADFLNWYDRCWQRKDSRSSDEPYTYWQRATGTSVYWTVPSLVEHLGWEDSAEVKTYNYEIGSQERKRRYTTFRSRRRGVATLTAAWFETEIPNVDWGNLECLSYMPLRDIEWEAMHWEDRVREECR